MKKTLPEALKELAKCHRQIKKAKRLFEMAGNQIPDYIDGQNDKVLDGISAWLHEQENKS